MYFLRFFLELIFAKKVKITKINSAKVPFPTFSIRKISSVKAVLRSPETWRQEVLRMLRLSPPSPRGLAEFIGKQPLLLQIWTILNKSIDQTLSFWNFNFICNLFGANGSFNSIISFYSIYLPSDLTTVVTKHFLNFYKTMWKTFSLLDDKYAWCNVSEVLFYRSVKFDFFWCSKFSTVFKVTNTYGKYFKTKLEVI